MAKAISGAIRWPQWAQRDRPVLETRGLPWGGCGDSSAEREFPSDKVYRGGDGRAIRRGRALRPA